MSSTRSAITAVHVFLDETREYYELERLWGDVSRIEWAEPATTRSKLVPLSRSAPAQGTGVQLRASAVTWPPPTT
jgi:hypothetical protein